MSLRHPVSIAHIYRSPLPRFTSKFASSEVRIQVLALASFEFQVEVLALVSEARLV